MLGSLHDAIGRLEFSFKWAAAIPDKTKLVEYYFDEISLIKLQELLNDTSCVSREILNQENHCSDCGGNTQSVLNIVYNLTPEEKQKELTQCLMYRNSAINFINKTLERNPNELVNCIKILKSKNLEIYLK